ncbi:MAG: nicotinamide riboside transporter PnuC [Sphingopyxis sp.]
MISPITMLQSSIGLAISPLECVAVVLGIINIALLVRRSIWNFPFGLAMVAAYFVVFLNARLYSDMLLQIFLFAVQAWGWAEWARAGGHDGPVAVSRLSPRGAVAWCAAWAAATTIWGGAMLLFTDAAQPFWDAAVAMGSVAAQILLTQRRLENWLAWIAVDVLAIGLYLNRDLVPTAGLYSLFLLMCVHGLVAWRRAPAVAVAE